MVNIREIKCQVILGVNMDYERMLQKSSVDMLLCHNMLSLFTACNRNSHHTSKRKRSLFFSACVWGEFPLYLKEGITCQNGMYI